MTRAKLLGAANSRIVAATSWQIEGGATPALAHDPQPGEAKARILLFRVRFGDEMSGRTKEWSSNPDWKPRPQDIEYFERNPVG